MVFLLFFVMLIGAAVAFVSIASADACFDPDATVLEQVKARMSVKNSETAFAFAEHVVTCTGETDITENLDEALAALTAAQGSLKGHRSEIEAFCQPKLGVKVLFGSTNASLFAVASAIKLTDCATVNPIYVNAVHQGWCTNVMGGTVQFFSGVVFVRGVRLWRNRSQQLAASRAAACSVRPHMPAAA